MFILRLLVILVVLIAGSLGISFVAAATLTAGPAVIVSMLGGLVWGAFIGQLTTPWLMGY